MPDQRALKILFDTYWSSTGWKRNRTVARSDFEYAKSAGVMFDSVILMHDEIVERARMAADRVAKNKVVCAFVSSLESRRLEIRSALGSYAVGRQLPIHKLTSSRVCPVCGEFAQTLSPTDRNILSFERFKWGGVRHSNPIYIWFDLEQFASDSVPEHIQQGVEILRVILGELSKLPHNARARDAERTLKSIIPSNKSERDMLINILGLCGILQPRNKSGFFDRFIEYHECVIPPGVNKIDWHYPVSWWRGSDGVNDRAVKFWFGDLLSD